VIKQLFFAREQKNSGKKFFLLIEHEVLFYETPFLHRATRIYVCGATALARAYHRPGRKREKERKKPAELGSEQTWAWRDRIGEREKESTSEVTTDPGERERKRGRNQQNRALSKREQRERKREKERERERERERKKQAKPVHCATAFRRSQQKWRVESYGKSADWRAQ
jgi:hypothetical protein